MAPFAQSAAAPQVMRADMPARHALGLIVRECRESIAHHRVAALAQDDPSGIHDVRVALRRLRAALGLFRGVVGTCEARAIDAEARDLADACSPTRDLQVFLVETAADAPTEVRRVGGELVARRLGDARAALGGSRFAEFDRGLERLVGRCSEGNGGGESLMAFARRALEDCAQRVRRRGRGLAGLGAQKLHRLRLAVKKLRYAVDILAPLFASRAARDYAEAAAELQDVLGKMNDRRMGRRVLGDIAHAGRSTPGVRRSCKRLAKRIGRSTGKQRKELKRAWKVLKRAEPFWHGDAAGDHESLSRVSGEAR